MRQNLKQSRTALGMTQREIAQKLQIHLRYYQKIEAGELEGKAHIWDRLEDLLNVPQRTLRKDTQSVSKTEEKEKSEK